MDRYDEKQLNLFRSIILKDIKYCDETIEKWQDKPDETAQQRRHMVNIYKAKKDQCESLLQEYDELFCDYIEKEEDEDGQGIGSNQVPLECMAELQ